MELSLKIIVFWYLTLCKLVNIYQFFGEIFFYECGIIYNNRDCMFLWNVYTYLPDYTVSRLRRLAFKRGTTFRRQFSSFISLLLFSPLYSVFLQNVIYFSFFVPFHSTFLMRFLLSVSEMSSTLLFRFPHVYCQFLLHVCFRLLQFHSYWFLTFSWHLNPEQCTLFICSYLTALVATNIKVVTVLGRMWKQVYVV